MKKQTFLIVVLIGLAIVIGFWRDNGESKLSLNTGTAFDEPLVFPDFSLVDMKNAAFTNGELKNKWSFLFFGYSKCPQICPATLESMKEISHSLRRGPFAQFVFISIDPENDTPAQLSDYFAQDAFKHTHILGVTGKKEDIHKVTSTVGIHVAQDPNAKKVGEHIEHGGAILLINPEGKIAAIFSTTNKPQAIVHDFKEIAHHYASVG